MGDGTSESTLSVATSTIGSSASTVSPTFLSHAETVPSVTDSPSSRHFDGLCHFYPFPLCVSSRVRAGNWQAKPLRLRQSPHSVLGVRE